jgi:hypothetical protein
LLQNDPKIFQRTTLLLPYGSMCRHTGYECWEVGEEIVELGWG